MTADSTWDFTHPASKTRILDLVRREADAMLQLAAEPTRWAAPTACAGWEVRDMIGHLVDVTESYLTALDNARHGVKAEEAVGVSGMAAASDRAARAFRSRPKQEMLKRLRRATNNFVEQFNDLSDDDWSHLMVPDPYLGPLPAMIIAVGLLGGYTVHTWDVQQGLGHVHAIDADAADLLVPFVFLLWSATADTAAIDAPFAIGIRTTGRNGGDTKVNIAKQGLRFASGSLDDCPAILELDPGTLVLTAYNRINAGTIHGDREIISAFRGLLVPI